MHRVAAALDDPLCAGIGEIGLDYHFDADDQIEAAPHAAQMNVMARQLSLAVERNVPVELHLRNDYGDEARTAHADAISVLERVGVPTAGCVLHCFGEDRATMERFLALGAISPSAVPRRSNATTPCGRRSPLVRSTACCWRRTAPIWRPSPFAAWSASRR